MIRAGTLRSKVRIERRATAADAYGDTAVTWATVAEVRASVESESSRERIAAGRAAGLVGYRVYTRLIGQDVTSADRIVWLRASSSGTTGDRVLSIDAAREERDGVVFACTYEMPGVTAFAELADEDAP